MPRANLAVTVPEGTWMAAVSNDHPDATFRVVSAFLREGAGVGVLEVESDDPVGLLGRLDRAPAVSRLSLLWSDERTALVQFETTAPTLLEVAHASGVPIRTPFEVRSGRARWEVTTTTERLGALRDHLDAAGIDYTVEAVGSVTDDRPAGLLTERQREVVTEAWELGYYESPRRASLTEVADALGVAKSTASDILHRAESNLVERFLAGWTDE